MPHAVDNAWTLFRKCRSSGAVWTVIAASTAVPCRGLMFRAVACCCGTVLAAGLPASCSCRLRCCGDHCVFTHILTKNRTKCVAQHWCCSDMNAVLCFSSVRLYSPSRRYQQHLKCRPARSGSTRGRSCQFTARMFWTRRPAQTQHAARLWQAVPPKGCSWTLLGLHSSVSHVPTHSQCPACLHGVRPACSR